MEPAGADPAVGRHQDQPHQRPAVGMRAVDETEVRRHPGGPSSSVAFTPGALLKALSVAVRTASKSRATISGRTKDRVVTVRLKGSVKGMTGVEPKLRSLLMKQIQKEIEAQLFGVRLQDGNNNSGNTNVNVNFSVFGDAGSSTSWIISPNVDVKTGGEKKTGGSGQAAKPRKKIAKKAIPPPG